MTGPTPAEERWASVSSRPLSRRETTISALIALAVFVFALAVIAAIAVWLLPALIHETASLIQWGGRIVRGWL